MEKGTKKDRISPSFIYREKNKGGKKTTIESIKNIKASILKITEILILFIF